MNTKQYWTRLIHKLDDLRLRTYLRRVEKHLTARDVSHLSHRQQAARRQQLDALAQYWKSGVFPRNSDFPTRRVPYVIDSGGRVCAVGHLLITSGRAKLARQLAQTANNAYIEDVKSPELDEWTSESGMTKEELAMIQPVYSGELIPAILVSGAVSIILSIINGLNIYRRQVGLWLPLLGLVAGIFVIYFAAQHHQVIDSPFIIRNDSYSTIGLIVGGLGIGVSLSSLLLHRAKENK